MKNNKGHIDLDNLDKNSKQNNFQIPNNYFDLLQDDIEQRINLDTDSVIPEGVKNSNFKVPADYHSALTAKFENELPEYSKVPSRSNLRTMYYAVGAIAALFIGVVILSPSAIEQEVLSANNVSISISVDEFQNSFIEEVEDFDPLIAMISEDEIDSEYDYMFAIEENKEVTTVADIQDLFIDEWEDSEYDY